MNKRGNLTPTCTHWGNYLVETRNNKLVAIHPYAEDKNPTLIGQSLLSSLDPGCRIADPMIRKDYLKKGWASDTTLRGKEPFVAVPWDEALEIASAALKHTRTEYGNEAIYGGSYGWASAGRFHHAQSQIHRFLNLFGGFAFSVDTYSAAAAERILPHVVGIPALQLFGQAPPVDEVAKHAKLMVIFGGSAIKNTQINLGGLGEHNASDQLRTVRNAGVEVINISPIKDDTPEFLGAEWWPCRPNSDTGTMLGIAHTLVTENLHDRRFLDKYCVGFEKFARYLLGGTDNQPKNAEWASRLSGIPADDIRNLAYKLARKHSVIGLSWSVQRQEHGEQPYWMATALAALLGHIGAPGGGIAYGYGCIHNFGFGGRRLPPYNTGALPQGTNAVQNFIPVARISDMLLNSGSYFDYNGEKLAYPDIKLVYWAGGNPFHHQCDLHKLRKAWSYPETIIINESVWTATARRADIVFPCTTSLERNDFGVGAFDSYLSPMHQAVQPFGQSRNDFDIFSGLASRLGFKDAFTEGRDEMEWVEYLYGVTRTNAASHGIGLPKFDEFWKGQQISIKDQLEDQLFPLELFRKDPEKYPLATPSGKIELYSETIASFGYEDCWGHPAWFDKQEWLGGAQSDRYPLHLISNQPRTRLHSQFDHGITSRNAKIKGREAARMHPLDAKSRNIRDGDVVRIFNDRGACLAGMKLSSSIRQGVVELPTGSWLELETGNALNSLEIHGNPNVLTPDRGTSKLAQGPTAMSCLVEIERFDNPLPPITVFQQPTIEKLK